MTNNVPKLGVAVHDIHWPKVNKKALRCLLQFLTENKVTTFIFGGDQFDFNSISHHTKGKGLFRTEAAYMRDIVGFDKNVLTPIEKLLPKGCVKVWILGNHERFEQDFIEEHPELKELIDHTRLLQLERRGWKVIPLGHGFKVGKLNVIHGEILTGIGNQAGAFPAKKAVELFAGNVLAGHTHAAQSYTRISPVNHREKWMGWIAPVLCDVNPVYLRNRPSAWLNGITAIETRGDGSFNLFPLVMTGGVMSYGGKTYEG